MRKLVLAALLTPLAGGCEMLDETYLIQQDVILDEQGVRVVSDMEEDFVGARWWQFRAFNQNDFPVCVQVTLSAGSQTSGHSLGGVYQLAPAGDADVGYINAPASFYVNAKAFGVGSDGVCGYPP